MAIKITNSPDEYDHVFLIEMSIVQQTLTFNYENPEYSISFAYRRYKIEEGGAIVFSPEAYTESEDASYVRAMIQASIGELQLATALAGNQTMVTKMINDSGVFTVEEE